MLKLILGRSGSGKTQKIRKELGTAVESGRYSKVCLLVPEQFSFESERVLYSQLGAQKSIKVEVVSFTRLANLVFREYGGLAKNYVGDGARAMLMSMALSELKDSLSVYKKHYANLAFVTGMVNAVTEFKNAGVTPLQLYQANERLEEGVLKAKTGELALIYNAYEALLAKGYADPLDDLPAANRLLAENDFFGGTAVFIDEFKGFTAVEYETLGYILRGAKQCTVSLCTDSLQDNAHGLGLFSPVTEAANRLVRMAKERQVTVAAPEVLSDPLRFAGKGIAAVEQGIFSFTPTACDAPPEDVHIFSAANPYEELELIASEIKQLVLEENLRYRDIVLIGRDVSAYKTVLESVLPRYDIPYFYDFTESIERSPLVSYLLGAVFAAVNRFDSDSILAMLKTGLTRFDAWEVAQLENYVFLWDIKGFAWCAPFKNHPRGFVNGMTEGDNALLERLNTLRQEIIPPLETLAAAIKSADGEAFARAVYEYITACGLQNRVQEQIAALKNENDYNQAQSVERVWGILMDILDTFASVLRGTVLDAKRSLELLRLAIGTYDMGSIPQTLDQVLIGSADRIRAASPKAAFLIGANEGVFPLIPQGGGLFTDSEREALADLGLELAETQTKKTIVERFIAYKVLTCPSQLLTVSYPRTGIKGEGLYPSQMVRQILQILPCLKVQDAAAFEVQHYIWNERTALKAAALHSNDNTPFAATLKELLQNSAAAPLYESLLFAGQKVHFTIGDNAIARKLFGEDLTFSPTGLETYYRCRFSYFLKNGIRLKKREQAKLTPLEAGSLIHYALQELLTRHTIQELAALSSAALRAEVGEVLNHYLLEKMGGAEGKPARFQYLYTRLSATVLKLIKQLITEFSQSDYTPEAFELPIKQGGAVEPIELITPVGARVRVEGTIDRLDIMTRNGKRYVRVVDYKTGHKSFNLSDVYYGLNMQMLLYLFTVCQNGRYAGAVPAGVLYMPAKNPVAEVLREADDSEVQLKQAEALKMNGLLLEDENAITGMEHGGAGIFIPARFTEGTDENGNRVWALDKKSKVASLENMGRVKRHIEKLVGDMACALYEGQIDAVPAQGGSYSPCDYCEFSHICGHEPNDEYIKIQDIPEEELFTRMEEASGEQKLDS